VSNIFPEPPSSSTLGPSPDAGAKKRLLMGVCIALGVLIVLALGGLIAGIALSGNTPPAPKDTPTVATKPAKPAKPVSMTLAPGYRILSSDTQPGRLILHVRSETQDEIDVIDLEDGRIISQIHAAAPQ
jgi:hypothetical protein